jgi:hypothetical protein
MKVDSGIRGADPSNCCLGQLLINQANHAGAIWWLTVAWWLCYLHDGLVSRQEISRPCACEFQSPRADRVVKWDAMFGFRQSKFKHIYGQGVKRELSYDNVRVTKNAWDSNLIKVNPLYLSVNWDSAGRPPLPPSLPRALSWCSGSDWYRRRCVGGYSSDRERKTSRHYPSLQRSLGTSAGH